MWDRRQRQEDPWRVKLMSSRLNEKAISKTRVEIRVNAVAHTFNSSPREAETGRSQ